MAIQGKVKSRIAILSDGNCGLNFPITIIREYITDYPYFSTQALRLKGIEKTINFRMDGHLE